MSNQRKIINDPVFGFINIPDDFIYDIIKHPYLQRLHRIKQLGLACLVYPGAQHTRFHHSIGAMHLMDEAIKQLRTKGADITEQERLAALACILMHDIGHGPFSHLLEYTLVSNVHHEEISLILMNRINEELGGKLDLCISIFKNEYRKKFLHDLVSGQLDVDRLDYLRRDSFFTGVTEGNIGSARIIKMLDIHDGRLVVESKGIYSIENFLMARRLMFWQVYLHKTAIAAEKMLTNTLQRAKELANQGVELFASPALHYFLYNPVTEQVFRQDENALTHFADLDDNDIWCALKVWSSHSDTVLATLSAHLVNRQLFKIEIHTEPVACEAQEKYLHRYMEKWNLTPREAGYFISSDEVSTNMYSEADDSIDILYKDGRIIDIAEASDMLNIQLLSKTVKKYYFCHLPI